MKIEVELDTNHLGYMEFRICKNNDINKYIDQECLDEHLLELADGSGTRFHVDDPVSEKYEIVCHLLTYCLITLQI